ncbi:MAG: glycosyltransferase family 39 protein [Chloroflexi bacterium]|nr:glycosyltransferase family 39 protein [Chloroflexota bacterium]
MALALRAAFVAYVPRQPDHYDDSYFYHGAGVSIAEGKGYRSPYTKSLTAMWPPGYPYALGAVYKAFGHGDGRAAKWLNVALGTATVALLGLAVRKNFGERAGLLAAAMMAAYPAHIYFAPLVMPETLFTFLLVAAYWALVCLPATIRTAAILGIASGVATLVRGEALLLLPAYAAYWMVHRRSPREGLLLATVAGVALVASVAPWTYRNHRVMDAFIPVNTWSGEALWQGHHAGATGAYGYGDAELLEQVTRDFPPKEAEVEFASRQQRAALRFMRDHPLEELRLIPRKLLYLWQGDGDAVAFWYRVPRGDGLVMSEFQVAQLRFASDFYYYATLAAAGAGVALLWRRRGRPDAPLAFIAVLTAGWLVMHAWLFFGDPRYHLPLMPFLLILAAAAVDELWRALSLTREASQ